MVEAITPMEEDFAQWYTDVVTKAELVDYSSLRGFMVLRPYSTAIWENIQSELNRRFKETGHENVLMPMLIPESFLQKEKEHVEGFAPEVALVTHGGGEKLAEPLCIRPTSETLFCEHYSHIVHSWRDLPKLYNQWCSVVRWEKSTRPFLRSREFYWQEGHTIHETAEDAVAETFRMLNVYADFCRESLAMPVIKGKKTEKEKFAGAVDTYTVEAIMHDGKALQAGTSHYFGDKFSRPFDITFTGRDNKINYPMQTSWGMSTRIIGAIIMSHGDNSGLKLPPRIAPCQVIVVPVASHKPGVKEAAEKIKQDILRYARAEIDLSEQSPGWKFAEYEMRGVPIRLEIGPRDLQNEQCVLVRRDTGEKSTVPLSSLEQEIPRLLDDIHMNMYNTAEKRLNDMTYSASTYDEFKKIFERGNGFVKAMWCGDRECEEKIKEETGVTSRCMPFEDEKVSDTCICCGKKAKAMVYWGKAY